MRSAVFVCLLAGCSSTSPSEAGSPDLSASQSVACTFAISGDESGSERCEKIYFCHSGGGYLLRFDEPTGIAELDFAVDGQFTAGRTYGAADLLSFSANLSFRSFSTRYLAGNQVAGSTVTLTLTDVAPTADQCPLTGGTAHGTAHVGLIEVLADDGGTRSPGHVTLDATF